MTTNDRRTPEQVRPERESERLNRDPISGAPGAHPVGTGAGAAAGGLTGAGIGAVAGGPVGAAIGGVAGAIAGGLAGKGIAENIDPTEEETYWRKTYETRPYYDRTLTFDDYAPAYRYGGKSWLDRRDSKRSFEDVESDLRTEWERAKAKSRLNWEKAKAAVRDGWEHVSNRFGPDSLRADDDGMRVDRDRAAKQWYDSSDDRT